MLSPARPPDRDTSFAVLFGFAKYHDHERFEELPAVDRSVNDLHAAISNPVTGGFAPENCVLQTGPTTVEDFGIRFQQAANKARDVLLVYYCGHGIIDDGLYVNSLYLAFPGTRKDYFRFTAMALREVKSVIAGSPARSKVFILDCCHSGLAHAQGGAADLRQEIEIEGTYILSSTSGLDYSWAPPGERYTAFTGALLDTLETSTWQPDPVPMRDVYLQVRATMQPRRLSVPNQSSERTADLVALVRPRRPGPAQEVAAPVGPRTRFNEQPAPRPAIPPRHEWPGESVLDLLRHHVNDPIRAADVERGISEMTGRLLASLSEDEQPPAPDVAVSDRVAALGRRLAGHEQAVAPMLRAFALGGRYGEPRHDMTWTRILDRVLNFRQAQPTTLRDDFTAANRYPALLLATALGVAAVAAGRPELAFRSMTQVRYTPHGVEHKPALMALTPLRVIAPDVAASLPGWDHEPTDMALCAHLRRHLRDVFTGVVSDGDYPRMFATWEYLRCLLTLDAGLFTPGLYADGPEGVRVGDLPLDLTGRSPLLQAGAFGGDPRRAATAREKIEASLRWGG